MTTADQTQPPTGAALEQVRWATVQYHLSAAFRIWREINMVSDQDLTFTQLVDFVSQPQAEAFLVRKMNQQVLNGGFRQWVDNRYVEGSTFRRLVGLLTQVLQHAHVRYPAGTRPVTQVLTILRRFDEAAEKFRIFNHPRESDVEQFSREIEDLGGRYAAYSDDFMDAVESYFAHNYPIAAPAQTSVPSDELSHRAALREVLDALGVLSNASELSNIIGDEELCRRILEAAERPE